MEKFKNFAKKHLWQYLLIVIGTGITAFGIQCIYDPVSLVTGGFSGLAIVVKSVSAKIPFIKAVWETGIPLWLTNLALNVPVFILAYIFLGKRMVGKSLFGTLMLSAWLYILPSIDLAQGDYLLAAIFGGVFSGGGIGLVLRAHATTGGTDLVAALFQHKLFRHYNVAQVMQVIDGIVVIVGLAVFGIRPTLYAVIAIFVTTQVGDLILEGFKFSRAAFIITDEYDRVAAELMDRLDRGVTGLTAKGMYTNNDKCVLYCVVSKKEIVALKELVTEIDPNAFVIVSDVREVLGEGFQEYQKEEK